jgi:hypothetical protein
MEPIVEVDVEEVIEPVAEVTEEVPVEPESTNEDAAETAEAATVEVEQEEKPSAEEAEEDSDGGPEELVEEEAEEVAEEVVEELAEKVPEEVVEEVAEEPEIEELPTAELVEDDAAEELSAIPVKKSFWKTLLKVVMWIIISLVLLTAAYVAVAHLCPQWIDQFLYTPEELELLDNIY